MLLGENDNPCTHSYECVRDFNPNYFFLIEYILVYYYDVNNNKYSYLEVILYGLY